MDPNPLQSLDATVAGEAPAPMPAARPQAVGQARASELELKTTLEQQLSSVSERVCAREGVCDDPEVPETDELGAHDHVVMESDEEPQMELLSTAEDDGIGNGNGPSFVEDLHEHNGVPTNEELEHIDTNPAEHPGDDNEEVIEHGDSSYAELEVSPVADVDQAGTLGADENEHTQMLLEEKMSSTDVQPTQLANAGLADLVLKGYLIKHVQVKGGINPTNIIKACKAKGMKPVCNYASQSKSGDCIMVTDFNYPFANMVYLEKLGGDKAARSFEFTFAYQVPSPGFNTGKSMGRANAKQMKEGSGYVACTKSVAKKQTLTLDRYTLTRHPFKGKSTNANLEKACPKGSKPVCAYGPHASGNCVSISSSWFTSDRYYQYSGIANYEVMFGAHFHGGKGWPYSWVNRGYTHGYSAGRHFDGEVMCAKENPTQCFKEIVFNSFKLRKVEFSGSATGANLYKACKAQGLRPVCNRFNYYDGRCVAVNGASSNYFSFGNWRTYLQMGLDVRATSNTYWYSGVKTSMYNTGKSHRHFNAKYDSNGGYTWCADPLRKERSFTYKGFKFTRTEFKGPASSENLVTACKGRGKPICLGYSYTDGECRLVTDQSNMANPSVIRRMNLPEWKMQGIFFYTGASRRKTYTYINNGLSVHWGNAKLHADGDTMCVERVNRKVVVTYAGYDLVRVPVKGKMTQNAIAKACAANGMQPVCVSPRYAKGGCILVQTKNFYFSYHSEKYGLDPMATLGSYWYAGGMDAHLKGEGRNLQNLGNTHRWSVTSGKTPDSNGDTFCTKPIREKQGFTYSGYKFFRIQVKGQMTSDNIYKACVAKKMRPVCVSSSSSYVDGKCRIATPRPGYHLSYPPQARNMQLEEAKLVGAYFYTGRSYAKTRSLQNVGYTHQWVYGTKASNGDTFCVQRTSEKMITSEFDGFKLIRVPIGKGKISDQNIQKACKKANKKYRPVCASTNYQNGDCTVLGSRGYWSIATQKPGVPAEFLMGAYFHCGLRHGRGSRSLQNLINTHRWSDRYDSDGDTICVEFDETKLNFEFRGVKAIRTRVAKPMTSNNVLAVCKAKGLLPICANRNYYIKGKCLKLPGVANFVSYPSQARSAGLPQTKIAGAGFWTRNPNSVLVNTGKTHRWSNARTDPNGWTYCAKAGKRKKGGPLEYQGYKFVKVALAKGKQGIDIISACAAKGSVPLCNYGGWADGKCIAPQGNKFFSYPPHVKSLGLNNAHFQGGYFYSGRGGRNMYYNTGRTHQAKARVVTANAFSYCVKKPRRIQKFTYEGILFKRAKFKGPPNNANILKACKAIKMKPVLNYGSWADSQSLLAGGNTYWSYPPHVKSMAGQKYVEKTIDSWWYSGRGNPNRALFNTGKTHRWSSARDKGGECFCGKRLSNKPFTWANRNFKRVPVKGLMSSENIAKACGAKNLKPVCAHSSYYDGVCEIFGNWWISHGSTAKKKGLSIGYIAGAYFYVGRNYRKTRSMQNAWNTHRWNTANRDKDGETICVTPKAESSFEYDGWKFKRLHVTGLMTSDNIYKTCAKAKMRPACAISSYADGRCRMIGRWYLTLPSQVRKQGLSNLLFQGAYFYTGRNQKGRSLCNRGDTHFWAHKTYDKYGGPTMCVSRTAKRTKETGSFSYGVNKVFRVPVKGKMTNAAIKKACNAKKMKPICVHPSYADASCEVIQQQSFWLSYANAKQGIDQKKLLGAYFFTGSHKNRKPMQNMVNTHRWSDPRYDADGDTFCTPSPRDKMGFTFRMYNFKRVLVKGPMTSANLLKTCKAIGMRPVCAGYQYSDGNCRIVSSPHLIAHPTYQRKLGLRPEKMLGTYFYVPEVRATGRTLYNNGVSYRWAVNTPDRKSVYDSDGDAWCVKRTNEFKKCKATFRFANYLISRTAVTGPMTGTNTAKACAAKGMRPICPYYSYMDGTCILVQPQGRWFNQPATAQEHGYMDQIEDTFLYVGRKQTQDRTYANTQWSNKWAYYRSKKVTDENGDTLCAKPIQKTQGWKWNGLSFSRVPVNGAMTNENIKKACAAAKLLTVCNGKMTSIGCTWITSEPQNWYFSDPNQGQRHSQPLFNNMGAYIYSAGKNKARLQTKSMENTGVNQRWMLPTYNRQTYDKDGDTICVDKAYTSPCSHRPPFRHNTPRLCRVQGGGHFSIFDGKRVTMTHRGVFQMVKHKDFEVHTLMDCWPTTKPDQYKTSDCRVKMPKAQAILVDGKVFVMRAMEDKDGLLKYGRVKYHLECKLDGKPVFRHLDELQTKATGDFKLTVGKYEITAVMGSWGKGNPWPKITVQKANGMQGNTYTGDFRFQAQMFYVTVWAYNKWLYGSVDGLCGWGCNAVEVTNLGKYLVSEKKQLFKHPQALKQWKGTFKRPTKYEISKAAKKCIEAMKLTPFGKLAWAQQNLRPMIGRHARNCGYDNLQQKGKKVPKKFNKKAMNAQICNTVKATMKTAIAKFGDVKATTCAILNACKKMQLINKAPATCKGVKINVGKSNKANGFITKPGAGSKKVSSFFKAYSKNVPLCIKLKEMTGTQKEIEAACWKLDHCTGYTFPHLKKPKAGFKGKGTLMNCGKESDAGWIARYRQYKGKYLTGRKHSHTALTGGRVSSKGVKFRRSCTCTNDIHCKPFRGGWFDLHWVATYVFVKDEKSGDYAQISTYHCRGGARPAWSGGLAIACLDSGAAMCNGKKYGPALRGHPRLRINCKGFHGTVGSTAMAISLGSIDDKTGICGGKHLHKSNGNFKVNGQLRKRRVYAGAQGPFSCADCFTGVGAWGAQCACREFMVKRDKQITTPKPYPSKAQLGRWHVKPQIDLAKVRELVAKCSRTFYLTPVGRLVLQHTGLWQTVARYAKGCAMDHMAKYKPKMVPNTEKVTANMCRQARVMADKAKDSLLCRIVQLCKLKSKKCGVTTPQNLWREWAKKNKGKLDFFSKYPKFKYKKKYSNKWPRCTNIECLDSQTQKTFEELCDKYTGCTGFTFPSGKGKTDKGSGCLKRCGRKEFGGKGKGKHSYWGKVDPSMPKRKTPRQKKLKQIMKRAVRRVAVEPKVVNAKNPANKAKKLVKKVVKKIAKVMAAKPKEVKKLVKKAEKQVIDKVAPAGKRGLVANQQQTQTKNGKKRTRKRSGAGKWAKHGCKVTQQWANAHIEWCPWGSWGNWDKKALKAEAHEAQLHAADPEGKVREEEAIRKDEGDY